MSSFSVKDHCIVFNSNQLELMRSNMQLILRVQRCLMTIKEARSGKCHDSKSVCPFLSYPCSPLCIEQIFATSRSIVEHRCQNMSQVDISLPSEPGSLDSQLQTPLGRCTQSQVVSCLTLNHLLVTSRRAKKIQICLKMKERESRGRFQGQGVRKVYRGLFHNMPIPSYFRNKISAAGNS